MEITPNIWYLAAVVITPTNSTLYLCGTNGVQSVVQTLANTLQPWGAGLTIGTDRIGVPGNNFGGVISSVAMFSNSLTPLQISSLYEAGGLGLIPPIITTDPIPVQYLLQGGSAAITASGYGGPSANGYWLYSANGTTFATPPVNADIQGTSGTATTGLYQTGTLIVTNFKSSDQGYYELVITNASGIANAAISTPVQLMLLQPAAGSFAAALTNSALGAVAFWPLNETGAIDAGSNVVAYDVIGGFNGIYQTNAQNGGINTWLGANEAAQPLLQPVAGAGVGSGFSTPNFPNGFTGLPATAYASLQNVVNNTWITTASSPTFGANNTNQTIVAWIYPNIPDTSMGGIWTIRSGAVTEALGTSIAAAGLLGYTWDNNSPTTYGWNSALPVLSNTWSMVGMVITATNSTLYVGNSNGLQMSVQTISNTFEPGALPVYIGTDPATTPGRSFGGAISSVAMFSNALSLAQMETLFDAGIASGSNAPILVADVAFPTNALFPVGSSFLPSYQLLTNYGGATITASAYTGPNGAAYWATNNGSGWGIVTSPEATGVYAPPTRPAWWIRWCWPTSWAGMPAPTR